MTDELKSFMARFCRAGADAVGIYTQISGEPAQTMPEYFLVSAICIALGKEQAITLETPWWQIREWMHEDHPKEKVGLEGSWKVDMVIYDGQGKHPNLQKVWAFVEVKNGYIDADFIEGRRTDREKLIRLHNGIHGPKHSYPYLVCCGAIHTTERRQYHKNQAEKNGDLWFETDVTNLSTDFGAHFFCGRVIQDFGLPGWLLKESIPAAID